MVLAVVVVVVVVLHRLFTMTSDLFSELYGTSRLGKKFHDPMELCNGYDRTEQLWFSVRRCLLGLVYVCYMV